MGTHKKYENLTREELIRRLEAVDGLIELVQREINHEELFSFPWAGHLGQWLWLIPDNRVIFNEKKASNIGYTKDDLPATVGFEFFTEKLHPEDYDGVMDNMRHHLAGETPAYEVEYRILRKDGTYAWYYDRGTVRKRDKHGRPLVIAGIVFDVTENKILEAGLKKANLKLRHLAQIDDLTTAYNKRYMTKKLIEEMDKLGNNSYFFSLMMVDLDNFKEVNDTYGHQAGDKLLQKVVRVIKATIAEEDLVARWGGDEFLILLKNKTLWQTQKIAEAIRLKLDPAYNGRNHPATVSIGLAEFKEKVKLEDAIHSVDQLMYLAKFSGKNKIAY